MTTYTLAGVRQMVQREIHRAGSLRTYAKHLGISAAYLSNVMTGRRPPGPKILVPLGLEKIEPRYELRYRKVTND